MRSSKLVVLLFLFSSLAFANINVDYKSILSGKEALQASHIEAMYEQFKSEFVHPEIGALRSSRLADADRKEIFASKVRTIIEHNSDESQTFQKGINGYSDFTNEEFRNYLNIPTAPQATCSATHGMELEAKNIPLKDMPKNWDWRKLGGVTPVKDQGSCGSCWTFSTVGAVEAHFLLKYGITRSFSEQQLVDCAGAYDNNGCSGGLPSHAFEYIKDNGGLSTETLYPYTAKDGTCYWSADIGSVEVVGGSVNITSGDEVEMKTQLFANGPVSVAFQVVDDFRDYSSGVYTSTMCLNAAENVNHAVLAVGYGYDTDKMMDYWIVKNSWGLDFGEQGYFNIQRGVNMCGIAVCNSFPYDVVDIQHRSATVDGRKAEVAQEFIQ